MISSFNNDIITYRGCSATREHSMSETSRWFRLGAAYVAALMLTSAMPVRASDVIAEWSTIQMPPAPTLKAVTVDPKTTALFLFDFMTTNCGERPRCVAAVPTLKALHDRARAAGMLVAYTLPGGGKIIDPSIAPREGEVVEQKPGGPDKFLGDDLDQRLRDHGIKTVILCGTSAQGVGLGTGAGAAQRGYYVIYPVDCLASESAFREAYAAWHMAGGGPPVTLPHLAEHNSETHARSTIALIAQLVKTSELCLPCHGILSPHRTGDRTDARDKAHDS
jgi:nicotinamidase-related amidase